MNLISAHFSTPWLVTGWLLAGWCLWRAARQVPWLRLAQAELTSWFGATVIILLLWQLKAQVQPGLAFHLLGATALTLVAGPDRARLGMAAVLVGDALQEPGHWGSLGLSWLLSAGLPTLLTSQLLLLARRHLPANYFVYLFCNGFAAAALSMWSMGLAGCVLLALAGAYPPDLLFEEHYPYYFLMGWPEAFTTGLHLTLLVVYRPQWVATFDDAFYLRRR
ncbi:energy-coupling factor ABC transporter permease [Chitiniphilus purpureus]|uniref:Energy-coupling factor ABC transporter permease n=1 Tax=Chitiniphilus purpureus TaxID=2981137 RepID=A0ABY6DHU9_9NEIS|nr:energy-coupling factor ABC transporter permease [Chitiniphilus sp. CD1]UXY13925.1 energy-coupling factor ABC transporter permease [Chitiniphilus sp. CD1]